MTDHPQHPLHGLSIKSFADVLEKLPPLDMKKVQGLIRQQRQRVLSPSLQQQQSKATAGKNALLLVSHDFKGNYRPSDFCTTSSICPPDECFTMEQGFAACDVFNYFSHTRISIPPPEWVAVCRKNGKKVIGTIITEWQEGFKECNEYLLGPGMDDRKLYQLILRLASLCVEHNFDGYLVNIENPIRDTSKMKKFVQLLNDTVVGMLGKERGLVLWYDSVISPSGELKWQNTLNKYNQTFFESCGGIFTNYHWGENHAVDALEVIENLNEEKKKQNAASPNSQQVKPPFSTNSVFFGTDCFGRGTFLGGQHESHKAVGVAMSLGLSAALFAPGWTMENFDHANLGKKFIDEGNSEKETDQKHKKWQAARSSFVDINTKFWKDIVRQLDENRSHNDALRVFNVPMSTTCCGSAGSLFSIFGSSSSKIGGWCQHSALEPQPNFTIPVELANSNTNNNNINNSSSHQQQYPVVLLEHTAENNTSSSCFLGNRTLQIRFDKIEERIELCRINVVNAHPAEEFPVHFDLVVTKAFVEELKNRNMAVQIEIDHIQDQRILEVKNDQKVEDEIFAFKNHCVLSATLPKVYSCTSSSVFLSLVAHHHRQKEKANNEVNEGNNIITPPPALSSSSTIITMPIGLLRVHQTESSKLFSLLVAQQQETNLGKSSVLQIVKRGDQILQLSLNQEALAGESIMMNQIESIMVIRNNIEFCGHVFVSGVFLKCEIPDQEEKGNFCLLLKMNDGGYRLCRF